MKFYNVPIELNNCMLHSISFAYLLPVLKDEKKLRKRIKKLFGEREEKSFNELKDFLEEIYLRLDSDYLKFIIENNKSNNNNIWNKNIKNLRIRTIDFMKKNWDKFPNWLKKSYNGEDLSGFETFEYIETINQRYLGDTMLERPHILALSKMLKISIITISDYESYQTKFIKKNSKKHPIYLRCSHNHYNFRLISKKEIIINFIRRKFHGICSFFHSLFFFKRNSSSQEEKRPLIDPNGESKSNKVRTLYKDLTDQRPQHHLRRSKSFSS